MKTLSLTTNQLLVLQAIQKKPLTSFEILKEVKSVPMILSLYTIIDDLNSKGAAKSYFKDNIKYHIAC